VRREGIEPNSCPFSELSAGQSEIHHHVPDHHVLSVQAAEPVRRQRCRASDRSEPGQSSLLACRAADSHANLQKMLRMAAGGDQISAPRVRQ